jgi:D-alanine-D-alanine ligase
MERLDVVVLYNEPSLAADDGDAASEAGVLESVAAVSDALARRGHRPRPLAVTQSSDPIVAALSGADVVFNLFEGFGGLGHGESDVARQVENAGLPITGSAGPSLALVRDKPRTKALLERAGLPTPESVTLEDPPDDERLSRLLALGPAIVKPACEDASLGIGPASIVAELAELRRQIDAVARRYGPVLVERFIVGREFNAAIVALPAPELLPLAEIEFCGSSPHGFGIVTYDAKWAESSDDYLQTPVRCPAQLDPEAARAIGQISLEAFRATGCRDYARVDLRMDEAGLAYVLEVNANPDIGPAAGLARALAAAGCAYDEFVERVVGAAWARGGRPPDTSRRCGGTGRNSARPAS